MPIFNLRKLFSSQCHCSKAGWLSYYMAFEMMRLLQLLYINMHMWTTVLEN